MNRSFENKDNEKNNTNIESSGVVNSSKSANELYGFNSGLTQLQSNADESNPVFQLQSFQKIADNSESVLQTKSLFGKIKAAGNTALSNASQMGSNAYNKAAEMGGAAKAAINQVNPYSDAGKANLENAYGKASEMKTAVRSKAEEFKSSAYNKAKGYGETAVSYASAAKDLPNIKNTVDNLSVRVNTLENKS